MNILSPFCGMSDRYSHDFWHPSQIEMPSFVTHKRTNKLSGYIKASQTFIRYSKWPEVNEKQLKQLG